MVFGNFKARESFAILRRTDSEGMPAFGTADLRTFGSDEAVGDIKRCSAFFAAYIHDSTPGRVLGTNQQGGRRAGRPAFQLPDLHAAHPDDNSRQPRTPHPGTPSHIETEVENISVLNLVSFALKP